MKVSADEACRKDEPVFLEQTFPPCAQAFESILSTQATGVNS